MIKDKWIEKSRNYEETTKEMQILIRKIIAKRNSISKLDIDLKMQKQELKNYEKRIDITQKKINVENARLEELESKLQDKFSEFQNLESNLDSTKGA
ncbi:hypothetical protein DCO58_10275 [Helicobacter saguini]|nr:hypothetical protein [Helicobacter saguini]MWV61310.1 hypothetical protein [Helicobacter saguini]MWV68021.1 hypothetical protein [Helicobacter saguini]MWV70512.1 hypothetical protein [Helicobacter saguini]MWV72415.1 hypothetical protein [Helicobacter saguini]TLD91318.1 hypothetical protein LS64_012105 [Helicobacter saguini]